MPNPVSMRLLSASVVGLFGGVFVAFGSVFLLEQRDRGYAEVDAAEDGLGLPCVGIVPAPGTPGKTSTALARTRNAALQTMVARLGLTDRNSGRRVVVIGSALRGEGKTGLIHDLAAVIAGAGRRVVVVESAPKDEAASRQSGQGSRNSDLSHGLRVTAVAERSHGGHLSMHAYERQHEDETPVFEGQDQFLAWLNTSVDQFDLVLVEAPAVLLDGRATALARVADLFILSVAWRRTTRASLSAAVGHLSALAKPSGSIVFAFTEVDVKRHRAYGPVDTLYFQNRYLGLSKSGTQGGLEGRTA